MSVLGQIVGGAVGQLPPPVIRSMAKQYAAGATVQEAMREVNLLRSLGIASTVAVLGEAATDRTYVERHLQELRSVLVAVGNAKDEVDVRLGIKPTALGVDVSPVLAGEALQDIAAEAGSCGCSVEVDMEQLGYVDTTLHMVSQARSAGQSNVFAVVQAYLYRTATDVERLVAEGVPTRIVKGTYKEGADNAYQLRESVQENFVALVHRYLRAGVTVGIATHDEYVIVRILQLLRELDVSKDRYEFQMIMGVQETLRRHLVNSGHTVRVTVHFGSDLHKWSIRRLKENPEIAKYAIVGIKDAVVSRVRHGRAGRLGQA